MSEEKQEKLEDSINEQSSTLSLEDQIALLLKDNKEIKELVQSLHTRMDSIQNDIKELGNIAVVSPRENSQKKNQFKNFFGRKGAAEKKKETEKKVVEKKRRDTKVEEKKKRRKKRRKKR